MKDTDMELLKNQDNKPEVSDFDKMFMVEEPVKDENAIDAKEVVNNEGAPEEWQNIPTTDNPDAGVDETEETKTPEEWTPEEEAKETPEEEKTEEEVDPEIQSLIDEISKEAEDIGNNTVDTVAEDLDKADWQDEILQRLADLEDQLTEKNLENQSFGRREESLVNKIQDLQDKLSEHEIKWYEYGTITKALDEDPKLKWLVSVLALKKVAPWKVSKEKEIAVLDKYLQDEFWVSVSELLNKKSEQSNQAMLGWENTQPVEAKATDNSSKSELDKMLWL